MAVMVPTKVTIIQGRKTSVGSEAFCAALTAITLTGIKFKPAACKQRNMICELEATSLVGLSSCKLSIAFNPKGVAALSKPSRLAEKFMIICPMEGCPFGISGKSLEKKGPTMRDKSLIPPAFSAMFIKPMNKAKIPTSFKQISTATQQVSMMPSNLSGFAGSDALPVTIKVKMCVSPKKKHLMPATVSATRIKADQILLNAMFELRIKNDE